MNAFHSIRRLLRMGVTIVLILVVSHGCTSWRPERIDLDNLRDDRALEIDSRLSKSREPVQNPFEAEEAE